MVLIVWFYVFTNANAAASMFARRAKIWEKNRRIELKWHGYVEQKRPSNIFSLDTQPNTTQMESTRTAHNNLMLEYERILHSTLQQIVIKTANDTTKSLNRHTHTRTNERTHTSIHRFAVWFFIFSSLILFLSFRILLFCCCCRRCRHSLPLSLSLLIQFKLAYFRRRRRHRYGCCHGCAKQISISWLCIASVLTTNLQLDQYIWWIDF